MALERGASSQRDRAVGQTNLFGGVDDASPEPPLPDVPQWTQQERLSHERELLGFYVTGHPLQEVAAQLARFTDTTASQAEGRDQREVRAGGLLTHMRETRTKRGARMAFGTLEDLEGSFELVIFSEPYERHFELLRAAAGGSGPEGPVPLVISGNLEAGDPPKILVRDVLKLSAAERELTSRLRLRVLEPDVSRDRMLALYKVLGQYSGDCNVHVHIMIPGESETELLVGGRRVRPVDELIRGCCHGASACTPAPRS